MEIKEVDHSNKWGVDFANLINSNRPKEKIGAVVGDVIDVNPLVIGTLNGDVIIDSDEHTVYVSSVYTNGLRVGDMVLVQPDETEQIFFIISKLVKVGSG